MGEQLENRLQRAQRARFTRRGFLGSAVVAGGAAWLAACGPTEEEDASGTEETPAATQSVDDETPAGEQEGSPTATDSDAPTEARRGGRLVFATNVDTPNLDPHMEISDARMRRSPLMYDTLVEWGEDLSPQPGLAESFDTDGTKWVFRLRRGAEFSNGKEVQANDVIYSLRRVFESPGEGFYSAITNMSAPDRYTVEFELSEPSAPLLAALGGRYAYIIPEDGDNEVDLQRTSLGSGAFIVREFVENEQLVLERNPNYWDADRVNLDELVIRIIPDEPTIVAGLRSGDVDLAIFEDSRNFFLTQEEPNLVTRQDPAARWDILDFPLDTSPFDNVHLRRAISAALDRPAIMSAAISDLGTLLGGHPPALWGALPPEEHPYFERDVERAKQLLEEGGIETPLHLTLRSIVGYSSLNAAAQVIVENLKEIDIQAEIEQVDLGIWIEDFQAGTFEDFTMNAWGGYVDPDLLYYNHLHQEPEGADFRGWDNDEISELLDEARFSLDQEEREQLYRQVQEICAEQCPWVPLYSADIISSHNQRVQNFTQHPSGYYHNFRYVWIEE